MRFAITTIALVGLAASAAQAQRHLGKIAGTVVQENGRPAAGVEVVMERSDGSHPLATKTDSEGHFVFRYVRHGLYDIRASHGHFVSAWRHNLMVRSSKITSVSLRLEHAETTPPAPASMRRP